VWEEVAPLIEAIIAKDKEAQSPMHIILCAHAAQKVLLLNLRLIRCRK
jgi:hypothetical protein